MFAFIWQHGATLLSTCQPVLPYLLGLQEGAGRASPFIFSTAKGFTGHQESGAGVAGLMEASLLVQHAALPPAVNLRNLNPHVHGALSSHAVTIARGGPYGAPSAQRDRALMLGVSSFGAQGTNAHALVAGSGAATAIAVNGDGLVGGAQWSCASYWVTPRIQVGQLKWRCPPLSNMLCKLAQLLLLYR